MSYKPLREVLSALDAQQRRELAALTGQVDETELNCVRNARKQLSQAAVFFIECSWESIALDLEVFSLEAETGKSTEAILELLESLRPQGPSYAWAWIRARMNARLMRLLESRVPGLLQQHPEKAALYADCLRQVDPYWFREAPLHHLKTGYHTALAVACKWYGAAFEMLPNMPQPCPHAHPRFHEELRLFASFSLTMLHRTDRYLWDSAGAEPLEGILNGGTLMIADRAIEELSLETVQDYGVRLGCPALRARREVGMPAFSGITHWVDSVFSRYLIEARS